MVLRTCSRLSDDGGGNDGYGRYYLENCSELQFSSAIHYRGFWVFLGLRHDKMPILMLIDYATDNDLEVYCDDGDRVGVMHDPSTKNPNPVDDDDENDE